MNQIVLPLLYFDSHATFYDMCHGDRNLIYIPDYKLYPFRLILRRAVWTAEAALFSPVRLAEIANALFL